MLEVDDMEFERVIIFKYLVSTLTKDNNITIQIKQNFDGKARNI
jgi:hypothetical protein